MHTVAAIALLLVANGRAQIARQKLYADLFTSDGTNSWVLGFEYWVLVCFFMIYFGFGFRGFT
jgi:hypothetical protein